MAINLTNAEIAMLTESKTERETLEDTLHRVLLPLVEKFSDMRLQRLAEEYRKLTPDLQLEALQVLKAWQASKSL